MVVSTTSDETKRLSKVYIQELKAWLSVLLVTKPTFTGVTLTGMVVGTTPNKINVYMS